MKTIIHQPEYSWAFWGELPLEKHHHRTRDVG